MVILLRPLGTSRGRRLEVLDEKINNRPLGLIIYSIFIGLGLDMLGEPNCRLSGNGDGPDDPFFGAFTPFCGDSAASTRPLPWGFLGERAVGERLSSLLNQAGFVACRVAGETPRSNLRKSANGRRHHAAEHRSGRLSFRQNHRRLIFPCQAGGAPGFLSTV
jgi:hypothetical protein